MKRRTDTCPAATTTVTPRRGLTQLSIQSIYAEAMRDFMADPRKAIAEHDPWLAAILPPTPALAGKA